MYPLYDLTPGVVSQMVVCSQISVKWNNCACEPCLFVRYCDVVVKF